MSEPVHEGGEKKCLNSELWHACAGPLVSLPAVGSRVVYFPQGHSEQVAATTNKEVDAQLPNYPNLQPQLICQLHNVTMHADAETDQVYAQMMLQPLTPEEQKNMYVPAELVTPSRQPTNYFCKTLTASDTSTHGGFSVPRRAAEKVFPQLDFSQTPPVQELIARDLHDVEWKFRHIFRGQPKRHLLTTGWSVFVSAKRLVAGDSVLFIWNEKNQLLLGIRRASRPQTVMPSSVLSSDSMHIGLLAAASHAAATNSCFTVFYNPRASPSEFVIPLSKYVKAVYHTRISVGMRFRMLFESEESSVRRYMGIIAGIGDMDPARWPNSHWRSVKVGWDESTAGDRQPRVSLWEIEPLAAFPMYPSVFPLRLKRPWYPGASSFQEAGSNEVMNSMAWMGREAGEPGLNTMNFPSLGMYPLMQQRFDPSVMRNDVDQQYPAAMLATGLYDFESGDMLKQFQTPVHYIPHSGIHSPLSQQHTQLVPQQVVSPSKEHPGGGHHAYQEAFLVQNDQAPDVPSPAVAKPNFGHSDDRLSASVARSSVQDMLGSMCHEANTNLLSFSLTGNPAENDRTTQQLWGAKISGKDGSVEPESCSFGAQNQALFGSNIDSTGLQLPTTMPSIRMSSVQPDLSPLPLVSSGYQSNPYGYLQDSSDMQHNTGLVDQPIPTPAQTFVKVYKTGSVGRSLDMARFNSYQELRHELGRMYGIEGLLEDPQRSGWQLVFVDREHDVLLLGDDPWEAFVNNVWYIKILSPEDVLKLGKEEAADTQNLISGLPSRGSPDY